MSLTEAQTNLRAAMARGYTDLAGVETVRVRTADLATVLAQPVGVAAGDFIRQIARLSHTADPDLLGPIELEDSHEALDRLIVKARDLLAAAPPAPSLPADRDDTAALVEAFAELQLSAFLAGRGSTRSDVQAPSMDDWRRLSANALANRTPPQPASDEVTK